MCVLVLYVSLDAYAFVCVCSCARVWLLKILNMKYYYGVNTSECSNSFF